MASEHGGQPRFMPRLRSAPCPRAADLPCPRAQYKPLRRCDQRSAGRGLRTPDRHFSGHRCEPGHERQPELRGV